MGRDEVPGSRATKVAWEDGSLSLHFLSSFESDMPCAGLEQEGEPTIPELVYFSHQKEVVGGKALQRGWTPAAQIRSGDLCCHLASSSAGGKALLYSEQPLAPGCMSWALCHTRGQLTSSLCGSLAES